MLEFQVLSQRSDENRVHSSLVVGVIGMTVKVTCDYIPHSSKYSKFVLCILGSLTTAC
jgi:hypothetical protein